MQKQGRAVREEAQSRGMRRIDLTVAQLASSETARRINRDIVLEMIRAHQPVSRADLARRSGLQRSTISQIVEQLIGEKWVCEGAMASPPRGRHPTMLELNENLVAMVADIHPGQASLALVDLKGNLLSHSLVALTFTPATSVERICECMDHMRQGMHGKSIEGIGLSLPGRVDPVTERMIFAPNLPWSDYDLKQEMEARLGLTVKMENAATACLLAELIFGRREGVRDVVLITISEGVGAGILSGGQLITGHRGMAGEFGHVQLDPEGPLCSCGQRGCWETFASCRAAVRYFQEHQPEAAAVSFQELLTLAEEGNSSATEALVRQAREIGRGLRMIFAVLAPELILLAGEITSAWPRLAPLIAAEVAAAPSGGRLPVIEPCHAGAIARLRGAAALVFQHGARESAVVRDAL